MKQYVCFVPGCNWQTHAEEEAEIVRRAIEHMRVAHPEIEIRESTIDQIKAQIREVDRASV